MYTEGSKYLTAIMIAILGDSSVVVRGRVVGAVPSVDGPGGGVATAVGRCNLRVFLETVDK